MYILIFLSLLINFLFFYIEIIPIIPKYYYGLRRRLAHHVRLDDDIFFNIIPSTESMLLRRKTLMSFSDHTDFVMEIYRLFNVKTDLSINNFHKAYLLYGYLMLVKNDSSKIVFIENICNRYIESDGSCKFGYKIVDHATYGLAFMFLYSLTQKKRFLNASIQIYDFLKTQVEPKTNIIIYRKNLKYTYVDTLGMACPFLFMYSFLFKSKEAELLAHWQIENYINHGLDAQSCLPFHAYDIESGLKLGPTNWGRGICWYILALSFGVVYASDLQKVTQYKQMLMKIEQVFSMNKNQNGSWNQFLGLGYKSHEDSSTTAMYIFSMMHANIKKFSKEELSSIFFNMINKNGYVTSCSGDTLGVNRYAFSFGRSELSQGFLCAILSLYNE